MPSKKSDEPVVTAPEPVNAPVAEKELSCPFCGSTKFRANEDGTCIGHCGNCGANYSQWATEANIGAARAWAERNVKATKRTFHSDAPKCRNKVRLLAGERAVVAECESQIWRHDGEKLLFCGKCGANWKGEQPANVKEVIEAAGPAIADVTMTNAVKISDEDKARVQRDLQNTKRIDPAKYNPGAGK